MDYCYFISRETWLKHHDDNDKLTRLSFKVSKVLFFLLVLASPCKWAISQNKVFYIHADVLHPNTDVLHNKNRCPTSQYRTDVQHLNTDVLHTSKDVLHLNTDVLHLTNTEVLNTDVLHHHTGTCILNTLMPYIPIFLDPNTDVLHPITDGQICVICRGLLNRILKPIFMSCGLDIQLTGPIWSFL